MNLGENIYRLRTQKNMSQGDLADALGVSRQSVSKWENNNAVPDLDKLVRMSELFGITLDELVSGKAPTAPQPEVPPESNIPSDTSLSRRQVVGIVFIFCAFVIILVFAISGEGFTGLLPGIPFILCFFLCFFSKLQHLCLWCTWIFTLPLIFIPFYEFIRFYDAWLITAVLWLGMLILTILTLRKDPVVLSKRIKALLICGYTSWFIYIFLRILRLSGIFSLTLIADRTIRYWVDAVFYLLFIFLLSITTRLLKRK